MRDEEILTLWEHRFKQIVKLEVESSQEYQHLLKRFSHLLDGTKVRKIIQKIIHDEDKHVAMSKKLFDIVKNEKKRRLEKTE
ncbi:MAG: rubrerythrin [Candidatus Omnitrophota bacterium]